MGEPSLSKSRPPGVVVDEDVAVEVAVRVQHDAGAAISAVGGSGAQSPVVNDRQGGGGAGGTVGRPSQEN